MKPHKYALLIRRAAKSADYDFTDMKDEDVIYFYEHSLWGAFHQVGIAAGLMLEAIAEKMKEYIDQFKAKEGGQLDD